MRTIRKQLNEKIEQLTRQISSELLVQSLETGGVPVAKVKTMKDVLKDPQQEENNLIISLPHARDGHMYATRLPLTFSSCDITPTASAPMLGEHNEEILRKDSGRCY